jgi:hypothetical protein
MQTIISTQGKQAIVLEDMPNRPGIKISQGSNRLIFDPAEVSNLIKALTHTTTPDKPKLVSYRRFAADDSVAPTPS